MGQRFQIRLADHPACNPVESAVLQATQNGQQERGNQPGALRSCRWSITRERELRMRANQRAGKVGWPKKQTPAGKAAGYADVGHGDAEGRGASQKCTRHEHGDNGRGMNGADHALGASSSGGSSSSKRASTEPPRVATRAAVHRLQRLLDRSPGRRGCLAVRRVTQDNRGKRTAGVDGVKYSTPPQRLASRRRCRSARPGTPVRRVWIPKTRQARSDARWASRRCGTARPRRC